MKTKITFLKPLLFTFALVASLNIQAQDPDAFVHLQFENSLDAAFEEYNGVALAYNTDSKEGSYSLDFDASTGNIITNNAYGGIRSTTPITITGSNARTITAWVKMASTASTLQTIVMMGNSTNTNGKLFSLQYNPNINKLLTSIGGTSEFTTTATNIADDTWHHVAVVYPQDGDLADVTFYVDNVEATNAGNAIGSTIAVNTQVDNATAAFNRMTIGSQRSAYNGKFTGGKMDDFRIYASALTAAEISTIYAGGFPLSINNADLSETVSVYPNPLQNNLNIKLANNISLEKATIYNITGKEILVSDQKVLDVSKLAAGIYVLKLSTSQGIATRKLVKE